MYFCSSGTVSWQASISVGCFPALCILEEGEVTNTVASVHAIVVNAEVRDPQDDFSRCVIVYHCPSVVRRPVRQGSLTPSQVAPAGDDATLPLVQR